MQYRRQARRIRPTIIAMAVAGCFAAPALHANPTGPTVVHGTALFQQTGNVLQVTNSPNAIIHWQSFSIGAGEITRFIQQSGASAVLNRVVGQNPSAILGALQSNGRVFLINPNGIVFGAGSQVDVAGLVASTLNLSNADFLAGRMRFTEVPGAGSVVNQGSISTSSAGNVYLVGPAVTNQGLITSPGGEVILAAGNSVELVNPGTPNLRVEVAAAENEARNLGTIVADAGRVGIYAGLIHHSGTIRADSAVATEDGRIVLRATKSVTVEATAVTTANGPAGGSVTIQSGDTTLVSGTIEAKGSEARGGTIQVLGNLVGLVENATIDASGAAGGGTVLVGGDFQGKNPDIPNAFRTYIGPEAVIRADATQAGDGGRVIVWADDVTRFYGAISARGGGEGGNGGFVEVSGKEVLRFYGAVDVRAPAGRAGTILLDPRDITIQDTGGAHNGQVTPGIDESILFADGGSAADFTLNDEALEALNGNVLLQAERNFIVNAGLSGGLNFVNQTAGETVVFQAGQDITISSALTTAGAGFVAQAGRHINIMAALTTNGGRIHLEADSPHAFSGAANAVGQVNIQAPVTSNGGAITLIAGGNRGTSNSIRGPDGNLSTIGDNGGFRPAAFVDAGTGGINLALSRNTDELGIGSTGHLTQILGNHSNPPDGAIVGSIANLRTTGALVIGTATTAGSDGLGTGAQVLTVNKISNVFNNSNITLSVASGGSFQLVAGSGGIELSRPLTTYQNTIITTTTGTLTVNQTLGTSNNPLTITAQNVVLGPSGSFNTGSGAFSCAGTGCPVVNTVFWDGGGADLSWFNALNWSGNVVPAPGQDVTIGSGFGTIVFNGAATVTSLVANSPVHISGGSLDVANASTFSDLFTLSGGTLQGTGLVTVGGTGGSLAWTGGSMTGSGSFTLAAGRSGTLSGTLTLGRLFQNDGLLVLNNVTVNNPGAGSIANAGLITSAAGTANVINAPLVNKVDIPVPATTVLGTIQLNGSLTAANFPTNDGTIHFAANNPTLATGGNSLTNAATGVITGNGTLNLGGATLTNNGTVGPGTSAGALTITGNYAQGAAGILALELGGLTPVTQYDRVVVTGNAALNGTLDVTYINGFGASVGDTFTVIQSGGAVSGTFGTTNLPAGSPLMTQYLPSSVNVLVPLPPSVQGAVAASQQSTASEATTGGEKQPEEARREIQKKPVCTGGYTGTPAAAAAAVRPVMIGLGGRCTAYGCF